MGELTIEQFSFKVMQRLDMRGLQRAIIAPLTSPGVIWVERPDGQLFTIKVEPGWRDE